MKLLLINYEYPPLGAGAATAAYNIANCWVKKHHEVTVLTAAYRNLKGWRNENGIQVFRCPAIRKKTFQSSLIEMYSFVLCASAALLPLIRKNDAMVVFFSLPCGPLGLWGNLVSGVPYIISLRGGDVPGTEPSLDLIHKLLRPLRHAIFRKSTAIVANSLGLKALSEATDPFKVRVIPNGVDAEYFCPYEKENARVSFLFVGRFRSQKNLFFLLDNMDKLGRHEDFILHLVGGGPLENKLKKYSDTLSIREKIFWHPWCEKKELRRFYREADCIVNPSLYEGIPNVVLEGMACGTAVIASRVAGNESLVDHGNTGFLFDLENPGQFRMWASAIAKDKTLAKRLGKNGRQRVKRNFSWDMVAESYLSFLKTNHSLFR